MIQGNVQGQPRGNHMVTHMVVPNCSQLAIGQNFLDAGVFTPDNLA